MGATAAARNVRITVFALAAALCTGAARCPAGAISAAQVLQGYEKSLNSVQRWSMAITFSTTSTQSVPVPKRGSEPAVDEETCLRDHDRWSVRYVVTASEYPSLVGRRKQAIINGWMVEFDQSPAGGAIGGSFASDWSRWMPMVVGYDVFMEGFTEDGPIVRLLRNVADLCVSDTPQVVDGRSCLKLAGNCIPFGRYTLWCDPQVGYLPRQITVEKSGQDLYQGRPIASRRLEGPKGVPTELLKLTYTVDSIQFRTIGDVSLPRAYRVTTRHDLAGGGWHVMTTRCTRNKIELDPKQITPETFVPALPDGFPLFNLDNPEKPYEWRGGKPVPRSQRADNGMPFTHPAMMRNAGAARSGCYSRALASQSSHSSSRSWAKRSSS